MVSFCGAQSRALKEMEKEKDKLLEELEEERRRGKREHQQHKADSKKIEETLRNEILNLTTACEREKVETLALIENMNATTTKISELQLVITGLEKDKIDYHNQQGEISEQAELKQKEAEKNAKELVAKIKTLQNDLEAMTSTAEERKCKIAAMTEEREQMSMEMGLLQQKLDNAVGLSLNHEELLHKTTNNLNVLGLKVEKLVSQLAKQKRKAGETKVIVQEFRDKVDILESNLIVQRKNETIQLSHLKELEENVFEKDQQVVEYAKNKKKLEVQLTNLYTDMELMKAKKDQESSS